MVQKNTVPPGDDSASPNEQNEQQAPRKPLGWHEPPVSPGASKPMNVAGWYKPENAAEIAPSSSSEPTQAAPLPGTTPDQAGLWYTPPDAQINALLASATDTIIEVHEPEPPAPKLPAKPQPQALADTQPQVLDDTQMQAVADTQAISVAGETQPQAAVAPGEGWSVPAGAAAAGDSGAAEAAPQVQPSPTAEPAPEEQSATRVLPADEFPPAATGESPNAMNAEPSAPSGSTPIPEVTPSQPTRGLSPAEIAFLAEQRAAGKLPPADQPPSAPAGEQPPAPAQAAPVTLEVRANVPTEPPVPAAPAATPLRSNPFKDVERKVNILRQRYKAGYLTREELQKELRSLMIIDDQGRWWMIGLESNRWYQYDGRDWTPGIPPGYEEEPAASSAVPTETGMQEVATPAEEQAFRPPKIELDEDGLPLPARVPQEDLGATIVSENAPFLEPVRRSEARTQTHGLQVEPGDVTISRAGPDSEQFTQPSRPVEEAGQTLRSLPVPDTMASPAIPVPGRRPANRAASQDTIPTTGIGEGADIPAAPVPVPGPGVRKPKLGEYPQPDYSEALGFSHNRRTYVRWAVRAGVFGIVGGMALTLCVLLGMVGYYFSVVGEYRSIVANLDERVSKFETSEIYDASGNLLAEFNDPNQGARRSIPLDQISPWLIHATISTENETFYTDPGFSVFAIVRAAYQNLQAGQTVSGASTITQQLARALVLEKDFARQQTAKRKIDEIIVASEIQRQYSKNQVLEIYLNEIFYGNLSYGIEAAAQTYFGKSAAQLNPAEAAFLAGLPQSPATYDPVVNREAAMQRMNAVLRLMAEANGDGCVTIQHDDRTEWAVPNGGALCITTQTAPDGSTLFFYQTPNMAAPEEMTLMIAQVQSQVFTGPTVNTRHPHFVNYVWQQLEDEYGAQAIYSAGYRVYTTLDETIQTAAEQKVTEQLAYINQNFAANANNASVVVIRPSDGAVLAMVGSADYNNEDIDGQVNVAFTAQQPGSAIKPILYLAAFEPTDGKYLTPASVLWDVYSDFNGYVPTNYDMTYHGPVSVRYALGNSLNVPAVKALNYIGLEDFTEMAKRVGLQFPLGDPLERQAGLPSALGAVEVRLFDMTAAFAMLANNGRRVDPYAIQYIEDRNGNVIYQADTTPEGLQVVRPEYAYLITSILADPDARADEFGYGAPLQLSGNRPAAVKTGTSNEARDVWTVGYTPQVVVGVWVGNTDDSPMGSSLSGYYGAAPLWNFVMETALSGKEVADFAPPAGLVQYEVCALTGAQASQACAGNTYTEIFAADAPPPPPDQSMFREATVDSYTGKLINQYCPDSPETRFFLVADDPFIAPWLNNTPEGNAWAQRMGIELPVGPLPTEECSPNDPRPSVVINYPPDGATVSGVIQIKGLVVMPDMDRYEVSYGEGQGPELFSVLFYDTVQHFTENEVLGTFDTRALPNGDVTLRLTAIDRQGRDFSRDVHINVQNVAPVQPTPAPTLTPQPGVPTPAAEQQVPGVQG